MMLNLLLLLQNSLKKTTNPSSLHSLPKALSFRSLSSYTQTPQLQNNKNRALRVLSLIPPKPIPNTTQHIHLRLVQKFIQTNPSSRSSGSSSSIEDAHNVFDEMLEHPFGDMTFPERLRIDPSAISNALSLCGSDRDLHCGVQYHGLSVRTGFLANVYIGSCLVSMYSKCGELSEAFRVFREMPVRNVVSWTAMISGFAQELQVECCLGIYRQMRELSLGPNDFTFTSLLSCLTASGALGCGRSCHCQVVKMGFESSVHVANALISMYCKCGVVEDALQIFRDMSRRDVVSWNSMIAGYSLHGLAEKAIDLFEEMKKRGIKPDAFTFLSVLSSCRHAGLVDEGQMYFESMMKHGVEPELGHYSCITDLLGRAGLLKEACDFIKNMPIPPNAVIWGSVLSSCRLHGNIWIGIEAAEKRLLLEPSCAATHILLANLYGSVGYWDKAARVRKAMKYNGLRTNPGYSWIEITNEVHKFKAEDRSNIRVNEILAALDGLADHMITLGYVPNMQEEDDALH